MALVHKIVGKHCIGVNSTTVRAIRKQCFFSRFNLEQNSNVLGYEIFSRLEPTKNWDIFQILKKILRKMKEILVYSCQNLKIFDCGALN